MVKCCAKTLTLDPTIRMWTGTLTTWLASIPTLALVILCMQNFMGVVNGGYANNWAAYLVQLVGHLDLLVERRVANGGHECHVEMPLQCACAVQRGMTSLRKLQSNPPWRELSAVQPSSVEARDHYPGLAALDNSSCLARRPSLNFVVVPTFAELIGPGVSHDTLASFSC